jgi:hypothetical protein
MREQEMILRRMGIIGTLIVVVVGGALLMTALIPSLATHLASLQSIEYASLQAMSQRVASEPLRSVRPPAPGLPTILLPSTIPAPSDPVPSTSPLVSGNTHREDRPVAAPAAALAPSSTDLTARLAAHLTCIQPEARHDPALDAQVADLARQNTIAPPASGAIQIAGPREQRIFLSPAMVAGLRARGGRCGETLVFGVPPLPWLPAGTHFGIGIDQRSEGIVVVVVTR